MSYQSSVRGVNKCMQLYGACTVCGVLESGRMPTWRHQWYVENDKRQRFTILEWLCHTVGACLLLPGTYFCIATLSTVRIPNGDSNLSN